MNHNRVSINGLSKNPRAKDTSINNGNINFINEFKRRNRQKTEKEQKKWDNNSPKE